MKGLGERKEEIGGMPLFRVIAGYHLTSMKVHISGHRHKYSATTHVLGQ